MGSVIDALVADAMASGTPIEGADGLVNQMTKAVLERALEVEMTHEVGDERAESGRSWFGKFPQVVIRPRPVSTPNGPVIMNVPRDRNGVVEPKIVPKHARRLGQK